VTPFPLSPFARERQGIDVVKYLLLLVSYTICCLVFQGSRTEEGIKGFGSSIVCSWLIKSKTGEFRKDLVDRLFCSSL